MANPDPLDSDMVAFPDPTEIEPHVIAFAGMMFAHAALEREIRALLDAITKTPGFGEQHSNQWRARERPQRIVKLIETHRGHDFPQTKQIEKLLNDAIDPCEQRNHLAHGTWWCFNRHTTAIVVRATRREHQEIPPERGEYTADDIYALVEKFKTVEVELYKLRRSIEQPVLNTETLMATIETELEKLRRSIEQLTNQDVKED